MGGDFHGDIIFTDDVWADIISCPHCKKISGCLDASFPLSLLENLPKKQRNEMFFLNRKATNLCNIVIHTKRI